MMAKSERLAGEGELIETASRRRKTWVMAALFVAGLPCGGYLGYQLARNDNDLSAPWHPTVALVITVVFLAAMLIGSVLLSKHLDEVERANQSKAAAFAGSVYVVTYPTWFFLWKGGFVAEPIHWALFILFWVALTASSIYYRYR